MQPLLSRGLLFVTVERDPEERVVSGSHAVILATKSDGWRGLVVYCGDGAGGGGDGCAWSVGLGCCLPNVAK